jgi:hypothetical protein
MQNFTYIPLTDSDKIRILRLQEGHGGAELVGELITLKQGEEMKYEALSYWWGRKEAGHVLMLKKDNVRYSFPILPELENALRQLRLRDQPRHLWVDAICIHQSDSVEKNAQIPKMAEIYSEASNVCVWLGTEANNSDKALKFIDRVLNLDEIDQLVTDEFKAEEWHAFSELIRRPWFNRRWIVQEVAMAKRATMHCGEGTVSWTNFKDAVALFSSRQEHLRHLFQSSRRFAHHPDFLGDIKELGANRLVFATDSMFRKSDEGKILEHLFSLETIMSSLSAFEASDPRDILYAVIRLANDAHPSAMQKRVASLVEDPNVMTPTVSPVKTFHGGNLVSDPQSAPVGPGPNDDSQSSNANTLQIPLFVRRAAAALLKPLQDKIITVDYQKSIFEVCKDFVAFVTGRSRSLDIICRPWAPPGEEYGLPSWICTRAGLAFERGEDHKYFRVGPDPLVGTPSLGRKIYNASGKTKAVLQFGDDLAQDVDTSKIKDLHKSLFVEGFVLDEIKSVQEMAVEGNIPVQWLKAVKWEKAGDQPPSRFWRTLVADRGPEGQVPLPPYYERACKHAFSKRTARAHLKVPQMIDHGTNSFTREFLQRVQAVVFNRKFFEDEYGNIGLAPSHAQQGDKICILHGCSVPVLLRKIERTQIDEAPDAIRKHSLSESTATADHASSVPEGQTRTQTLTPDSNSNPGSTNRLDFVPVESNDTTRLQADATDTTGSRLTARNADNGSAGRSPKRKRSVTDVGPQRTSARRSMSASSE